MNGSAEQQLAILQNAEVHGTLLKVYAALLFPDYALKFLSYNLEQFRLLFEQIMCVLLHCRGILGYNL